MILLLLKPKILSLRNSVNTKLILRRLPFIAIGVGFWFLFISAPIKF